MATEITTEYKGYPIVYKEYSNMWVALEDDLEILVKAGLREVKDAIDAREKRRVDKQKGQVQYIKVYWLTSYGPPERGKTRTVSKKRGKLFALITLENGERKEREAEELYAVNEHNARLVHAVTLHWANIERHLSDIAETVKGMQKADLSALDLD